MTAILKKTALCKTMGCLQGQTGVLTAGIGLLHQEYSNAQKRIELKDALEALHGSHFNVSLQRCFPHNVFMTEEHRAIVANKICQGPLATNFRIDSSSNEDPLAQLVRAGILTIEGTFFAC